VATASGVGMRIEKDAIPVRPEVEAVCAAAGMDPYISISEGTLLATVRPERAEAFLEALAAEGIDAAVVGEVTEPASGLIMIDGGRETTLTHPGLDPFWGAFGRWATEAAGDANGERPIMEA
jgi:hydrogenase expression/formation protein HypE